MLGRRPRPGTAVCTFIRPSSALHLHLHLYILREPVPLHLEPAPPRAAARRVARPLAEPHLGGYLNAVYRSNLTAAQVLFTAPEAASPQQPNRFLVALPAGNSGSCVFFFPAAAAAGADADDADGAADADRGFTGPERTMQRSQSGGNNLSVTLEPGSLSSALGPNGLHGVKGTMLVSSNATLNWTQIGAWPLVLLHNDGGG